MGLNSWWRNRGRDYARFPADENGDVLWMMQRSGDDLGKSRNMNFAFLFPSEEVATKFSALASQKGYEAEVNYFEEKQSWDVQCSIVITPTHQSVTDIESSLSTLAAPYQGKADGWGSFAQ